jgi:amino acid adenylation domain-containing protein
MVDRWTVEASASPPGSAPDPTRRFVEFDRAALDRPVPARFAEQVRQHATRLAVKSPGAALTYGELDAAADRVAAALLAARGPGAEPVGILIELGASFVVALLGVLKAGKIFLPLDPAAPPARIRAVLDDAGAAACVSGGPALARAGALAATGRPLLDVDRPPTPPAPPQPRPVSADDPACIVYTSGSTGTPKGVVQTHRNLLHQALLYANEKRLTADDRYAPLASPGAIYATWIVLTAVLTGGSVFPLPPANMGKLLDWIDQEAISVTGGGRALVRELGASRSRAARQFPGVRLVSFGGEPLYRSDVEEVWRHFPSAIVRTGLGATETGAVTSYFLDRTTPIAGHRLPIGYPCVDKTILILGEDGTELGADEVGEIAVRSRYLAPGYFRRPDLTAMAFQPAPGGEQVYRTGDLGLRRPDGCLMHVGRKDLQVKVRGYRVETAEIEGALLAVPGVRDAAVVAREDVPEDGKLVAYVVVGAAPGPTVSALRRTLAATLPPYMQPAAFVTLEALPLTPNRKLDRSALPPPTAARPALDSPYLAPRTPVEATLAGIWAEALGLEAVGVLDTFGDLGGHSLVATRIAARVADAFRVDIPLPRLMEATTVAAMALLVVDALAAALDPAALASMVDEVRREPEPMPGAHGTA